MDNMRKDETVGEEAAALGQRAKGATKEAYGTMTGDREVRIAGERENADGRKHDALVTGMYTSPQQAERAYHDLTTKHGYKAEEISVLMSDESRKRHFGDVKPGQEFEKGTKAAEGAGVGGGVGMGVGAALGALLAIGTSIVIPGLGLVVAGPIAAALAGAGAGGVTGGLIGALVGAGIPEVRATEYERGINNGGIVLGTRARDDKHSAELQNDYKNWGATQVKA